MIKCELRIGISGDLAERIIGFEFDDEKESLGIVVMELGSKIMEERDMQIRSKLDDIEAGLTKGYNMIHFNGMHPNSKEAKKV